MKQHEMKFHGQNNAIIDCKFHLLDNFMNGRDENDERFLKDLSQHNLKTRINLVSTTLFYTKSALFIERQINMS
ncbi:hypothetical protein T11_4718 [Trichinella zimbabwensis]|uniref:Uncharacterized protein n=1 Tax=Trichinella zimbabwensis TaxID=268475 RepID=A0A0V1HFL7_9BILA|nr:hypothetical protein T11_4718 [Trichinella zimbabwensis]